MARPSAAVSGCACVPLRAAVRSLALTWAGGRRVWASSGVGECCVEKRSCAAVEEESHTASGVGGGFEEDDEDTATALRLKTIAAVAAQQYSSGRAAVAAAKPGRQRVCRVVPDGKRHARPRFGTGLGQGFYGAIMMTRWRTVARASGTAACSWSDPRAGIRGSLRFGSRCLACGRSQRG
jgi:hypothetical protein